MAVRLFPRALPGLVRTAALSTAFCAAAAGVPAQQPLAAALTAAPLRSSPAATPGPPRRSLLLADSLLTGRGDALGYHLDLTDGADAASTREVALLAPGGASPRSWSGYQCLSADGRYAAVVVAPISAANSPVLRERGATGYAVDLLTGAARPVAEHVAFVYHSPGCGLDDRAVFASFPAGSQEAVTDLTTVDLAGHLPTTRVRVGHQVSSAVPFGSALAAVIGTTIVALPSAGHLGPATTLAALPAGSPYDLRPSADGGLDLAAADPAHQLGSAWHLHSGHLTLLGTGPLTGVAVLTGSNGRNVVTGLPASTHLATGAIRLKSLDPGVAFSGLAATTSTTTTTTTTTTTATPACAVPRNDPARQVMQPSTAQVDWASQLAEQGRLTGSLGRPANYANLGLAAYAASTDFPPVALSRPSGSSQSTVPRSVYDAIMAQESNWDQASFDALPGIPGNPLVADYYGAAGSTSAINYARSDCGYGLGQVTTGMRGGDTAYSAHGQLKIAVDYEENVAAGLNILERTWNQLYAAGIIANTGDPKFLENWYFAAWAYNTGIQPTGTYNTKGCSAAGPSCTGPDGTWGLGWSNNPANPNYPPNRAPYLKATYADASHPGNWPYQERILGWMGSPLLDGAGNRRYAKPTYQGGSTWLQVPAFNAFCTRAGNACTPGTAGRSSGTCTLKDAECWWHTPVTWVASCPTTCASSAYSASAGPEPVATDPHPPTCSAAPADLPTSGNGAPIIVADQGSPPLNLVGCTSSNWSSNGSFTYSPGTDANNNPSGLVDTHQLGVGFGGRILFTHTQDGSNAALMNTGSWKPTLPKSQYYTVKVHVPATGAAVTDARYTLTTGGFGGPVSVSVNQHQNREVWLTLGTFKLGAGATLSLSNKSSMTAGLYDVAFDAAAFLPQGATAGTS